MSKDDVEDLGSSRVRGCRKAEEVFDFVFEICFEHFYGHHANGRTECFHGRLPNVVIARNSKEVMPGPSDAKNRILFPIGLDSPPIVWDRMLRGSGASDLDMAREVARFNKNAHGLTDGVTICGWVFDSAITLIEEHDVTDQVRIALHGMTLVNLVTNAGRVLAVRVGI